MELTEDAVQAINYQLDDLKVDGTHRFSLSDYFSVNNLADQEMQPIDVIAKFNDTFQSLLHTLSFHDPVVRHQDIKADSSLGDVLNALGTSNASGVTLNSEHAYYRTMHLLCSLLQCARLRNAAASGHRRKQRAGDRGKVVFQLEKICKELSISFDGQFNPDEVSITSVIRDKVATVLSDVPVSVVHAPPTILSAQDTELNDVQRAQFEQIRKSFHEDFHLRRRMLMKRLDVTIQSFLWGNQVQGKESEIVAAIEAQRQNLSAEPTAYTLDDVKSAPLSLIREHSKKVTEQGSGKKSLVKTIIIGAVPDRGGRANEMRPKASDMRPNYGGGHGNGGRGHGNNKSDGKSDRGGGHNNRGGGGHQNKRGRY